jgi:hypothetical protein
LGNHSPLLRERDNSELEAAELIFHLDFFFVNHFSCSFGPPLGTSKRHEGFLKMPPPWLPLARFTDKSSTSSVRTLGRRRRKVCGVGKKSYVWLKTRFNTVVSAACRDQPIVSKVDTITGGQIPLERKEVHGTNSFCIKLHVGNLVGMLKRTLVVPHSFPFLFLLPFPSMFCPSFVSGRWGVYLTDQRTRESKFERNRSEKFVSVYCPRIML